MIITVIIHFAFKSKVCSKIGFSATSIYWTSTRLGKRNFPEKSLSEAITFLIKNCHFPIRNRVFKQDTGIPMGINLAPFWESLFVSFLLSFFIHLFIFESKHVQNLISKKSTRFCKY